MFKSIKYLAPVAILSLVASTALAASKATDPSVKANADVNSTLEKLKRSIAAKNRPAADVARDADRLPLETLSFFGLRDDMKVLDLLPASYYTFILAPVLKEKGELYFALGTAELSKSLLKNEEFRQVRTISEKTIVERPEGARYYDLKNLDIDVQGLDMVTNFRVYHLFDDADRSDLNQAVFRALKSGGIYAVIDHTARHNEPETEGNRRRFDPVKAIKEIESAGFDFVDYSSLHYRPADGLDLEVGHDAVTGKTDRWALKFVKP